MNTAFCFDSDSLCDCAIGPRCECSRSMATDVKGGLRDTLQSRRVPLQLTPGAPSDGPSDLRDTPNEQSTKVYENDPDFVRYVGGWKAGAPSGTGVMHYRNGSRYEGQWLHGGLFGFGKLFEADGSVVAGLWRADEFIASQSAPSDVVVYKNGDRIGVRSASPAVPAVGAWNGVIIKNGNHTMDSGGTIRCTAPE
jgi:hypothetical protein